MTWRGDRQVDEVDMSKAEEERIGRLLVHRLLNLRKHFPEATGLSGYDARESDIVITTFAKAGTTLLQQMGYQLAVLSGGAGDKDATGEDYTDITIVSPWIDYRPQFGVPFYESFPRVLKTHSRPHKFHDAGLSVQKHVVVIRDPKDYPASWLNFLYDSGVSNGMPDFAPYVHVRNRRGVRDAAFHEFVRLEMLRQPAGNAALDARPQLDWFDFARDWLRVYTHDRRACTQQPREPRVLVLFYEDVVADLPHTVRTLARFMRIDTSDRMVETVVRRCDRAYMGGNDKFRCQVEARVFNLGNQASKARRQDVKGFKEFEFYDSEKEALRKRFRDVFDVDCYEDLKKRVVNGADFWRDHFVFSGQSGL